MGRVKDLTGQIFGSRTVIGRAEGSGKNRGSLWLVRCQCGREEIVESSSLRRSKVCRACNYNVFKEAMSEDIIIDVKGNELFSSTYISKLLGVNHGEVNIKTKLYYPDIEAIMNKNGQISGYYLNSIQAMRVLSSFNLLPAPAKALLARLGDKLQSSVSVEGLFYDVLSAMLVGFNIGSGYNIHIVRQYIKNNYRFDFYIPEVDLYIEFNERGSHSTHHKPDYDTEKAQSVKESPLLTLWGNISHYENALKVVKAIELILAK